jgi:hypothetical protein
MWAVIASAAGRGVPEDELALFDQHAGWEGVTPDAVENAIAVPMRRSRERTAA